MTYLNCARVVAALLSAVLCNFAVAQPAPWTQATPLVITEHSGAALVDHQVLLHIDTQALIGAGQLQADADNLRFGSDSVGSTLFPHWIEGGVGSTDTRIWVRVPAIPASGELGLFMYTGNAAAASTSTLDVFDYESDLANSATQQVSGGSSGGVPDSQRGFRFSVNEELLMVSLGKNEPNGSDRTITVFDFATQAILEQQQVSGPPGVYAYQPLPQPRWLVPGQEYLAVIHQGSTDGYYFDTNPQVSPRLTYLDMRYCNACTASTFPTQFLGGMHYGYVDFQFRTRKQASPQPTGAFGPAASTTTLAADANPADFGTTVVLTASVTAPFPPSGTVAFAIDGVPECSATLAAGVASCAVAGLAVGTYPVDANYAGDAQLGASSDLLSLQVQAVVPGAPTDIAAIAGDGQAQIGFTPPAFDGGASMDFTARCSDGFSVFPASGVSAPLTVTGLSNGTTYQCDVIASNSVGDGPASSAVAVTPAAIPGAPTALTATAGDAQAQLAFAAPASDGGSPITGYVASCSDGAASFGANGPASPLAVTGLANGTTYTCTVAATNAVGTGPVSAPVSVLPQGVPGAPTGVVASAADASAQVAFDAPAADGGSAITGYTASCTDGTATFSASDAASPLLVTGLTNGTSYTCTVTATNAVGIGPQSAPASVVPQSVPGAPTGVVASAANASAQVAFDAPTADGGSAITGYAASCTDGTATFSASGAASPLLVTGLTNGTSYGCTVTASNALGQGPASSPAALVVPVALPGAPTGITASPGDAQITVGFVAPASDGGSAITHYVATCSDGTASVSASGTVAPIIVAGLSNGRSHACTVQAVSAVGTGPASAAAVATPSGAPAQVMEPAVIPALGTGGLLLLVLTMLGSAVLLRRRG